MKNNFNKAHHIGIVVQDMPGLHFLPTQTIANALGEPIQARNAHWPDME